MKMILALLFLPILALATDATISGSHYQNVEPITFNAGVTLKKTHLMLLAGSVYLDTSSTGQANEFKRIDNTADSCSNPVWVTLPAPDSLGKTRPNFEQRIMAVARSVDKDSSAYVLRVQTRERVWNQTLGAYKWTAWTVNGANQGYGDLTVQDQVLFPTIKTTARAAQYALYSVFGVQQRFCPDNSASTGTAATDTVHADSLIYFGR